MDATTDKVSLHTIGLGGTLQSMQVANGRTIVSEASLNAFGTIDNTTETSQAILYAPANIDGFAASGDNIYFAMPVVGQIGIGNAATQAVTSMPALPLLRRLVVSHDGKHVLGFADNNDSFIIFDTSSSTVTTISGFDRPYSAVFSNDDSKAYILNCGPECGGATSSVSVFDMASATVMANVPVPGATVGASDGTNLYVAGADYSGGTFHASNLTTIGLTTLAATSKVIGDGLHTTIAIPGSNRVYVGAQDCVNGATGAVSGCLSIFNTSSGTVTISDPSLGQVNAITPIPNRTVVYVAEGGELVIYDATTDAPLPTTSQIDFSGKIVDVKVID